MSEKIVNYEYTRQDIDLRSSTLRTFDNNWETPTPDEIRRVIEYAGHATDPGKKKLTGSEAGLIIGVNERTVRRYTAPVDAKNYREMPYSAWRLLLQYAGLVDPQIAKTLTEAAETH